MIFRKNLMKTIRKLNDPDLLDIFAKSKNQ